MNPDFLRIFCRSFLMLWMVCIYDQSTRFVNNALKGTPGPRPQAGDVHPHRQQLLMEWQNFKPYHPEEQAKKLPDFIKGQYNLSTTSNGQHSDVILATHTSIDNEKLKRVDILHRYWQGPISIAIRIRSGIEIDQFFDYFEQLPTNITNNWTVHFLFEKLGEDIKPDSRAAQYCHNVLRNLALHSPSIPDFVFSVDLDLFPTYGGYPKLMEVLQDYPSMWDEMKKDKKLLVVPIMEVVHIPDSWGMDSTKLAETLREIESIPKNHNRTDAQQKLVQDLKHLGIYEEGVESDLPKSREDLKLMYKYNVARDWHNKHGHAPTNLTKYWAFSRPSGKKFESSRGMLYPVKPNYHYEPYFIGYKPELPKFWEGFRGYGLDKQSFVRECILAGHKMEVLFELYLTHLAHPSNNSPKNRNHNEKVWDDEFQYHLEKHYSKPDFDPKGEWWYADGKPRDNRQKYVTNLRAKQYGA